MSLFNNFRFHYHKKNLESLINTEKYLDYFAYLKKFSEHKELFYKLSLPDVSKAIANYNGDILDNRIIWINSFLKDDLQYLNRFFSYYLKEINNQPLDINFYFEEIDKVISKEDNINFNTMINQSYFFQWIILSNTQAKYKIIFNDMPFFSTKENFNFTNSKITQSFIYLINDPYKVYQKIKNDNNNDQDLARNIFLNLDNKPIEENYGKSHFNIHKKGWDTNVLSWTDPNVINSLRGKSILQKNLIHEPFETLSSIILHLKQSGANIELNYDLIENFIDTELPNTNDELSLSVKEKKFIDQYIEEIKSTYDLS